MNLNEKLEYALNAFFEAKVTEAVDQSLGLNEATLKVSNFTGKIADKAGFKMKKVGDCNPGASVVLTGDEKAIIAYAKKYLGAEGDKISDFQSDLIGGPGCAFEETQLEKVECPKCEGKGCDHCGGEGYHEAKKSDEEKLDPVGKADADIDNDGDVDDADDYLKNRRKKIGKAIDAKKLKEMAKAFKTESIKGGLEKGADGYSSHDYHRIAIALAGGKAAYDRMPYGTAQSYRDKAHEISNSEKDRILSQPTPR